jgi:hypothetical protein
LGMRERWGSGGGRLAKDATGLIVREKQGRPPAAPWR